MNSIELRQVPQFKKITKKLHKNELSILNEEIKKLIQTPLSGELKKGDLAGVRVTKFKIGVQQYLLSYLFEKNVLTLLSFGSHENYYKNLKKLL